MSWLGFGEWVCFRNENGEASMPPMLGSLVGGMDGVAVGVTEVLVLIAGVDDGAPRAGEPDAGGTGLRRIEGLGMMTPPMFDRLTATTGGVLVVPLRFVESFEPA